MSQWNAAAGEGGGSFIPLPIPCPVDEEGKYTREVVGLLGGAPLSLELVGLPVLGEGGERVLAALGASPTLFSLQKLQHRYPYDSRARAPVIVRATAPWFLETGARGSAGEGALARVKFYPAGGEERLRAALAGRTSWCISRQRAWGVPIPAFFNSRTGEELLTEETCESLAKAVEESNSSSGGGLT